MDEVNYIDPVTAYVRQLPQADFILPREAAVILGISYDRLRYLARLDPERLGPGHLTWWGEMKIFLYDQDDLAQLRAYFAHRESIRPAALDPFAGGRGRPPMWTTEERKSRHRREIECRYYRRRAEILEGRGQHEKATQARVRSERLLQGLTAERAERLATLEPDRWS